MSYQHHQRHQFCTFYCDPLATWYTFKYFDYIFDAFCEIKISGHFCRFHCERLAFWQVQVSGSSCVAHPRDFYGGFSNLERLCDNKKRIFAKQKWCPTLKTFFPLDQTNAYGLIIWLVYSLFPLKAFFSSLCHLTMKLIFIRIWDISSPFFVPVGLIILRLWVWDNVIFQLDQLTPFMKGSCTLVSL